MCKCELAGALVHNCFYSLLNETFSFKQHLSNPIWKTHESAVWYFIYFIMVARKIFNNLFIKCLPWFTDKFSTELAYVHSNDLKDLK